MAEQAVIKDDTAQPVPDRLTDEQRAMIEPAAVAMYGVDRGGVTAGFPVLVSGAGSIGAVTILAPHRAFDRFGKFPGGKWDRRPHCRAAQSVRAGADRRRPAARGRSGHRQFLLARHAR